MSFIDDMIVGTETEKGYDSKGSSREIGKK